MIPQYYIAALPDLSLDFYKNLEKLYELECYPEIRLPFHVTLFYLGELNKKQKEKVLHWFDEKKEIPRIDARIKGMKSFDKEEQPFVYFLDLDSLELETLNKEFSVFSDIHKDSFSFIPHLSLFFPKLNIKQENNNFLKEIFKNINTISFKNIYLGSVIDNVTHIHKSIPCI
jgi:2'-5' RNA ligase